MAKEKFELTAVQVRFPMHYSGYFDLTTRIKESYHTYDFN